MGLDMWIRARRKGATGEYDLNLRSTDAKHLDSEEGMELAYWRKHPDLHGYIVRRYGGGVDECQEIPLTKEAVNDIIMAVKNHRLPETTGFFFGKSDKEETMEFHYTLWKLYSILEWLKWQNDNPFRNPKEPPPEIEIFYRASW